MTTEELRRLAAAASAWDPAERTRALAEVGTLTAADVLPFLDSDDRNVRVAALRVLTLTGDPAGADGILRGLDDDKKRVRNVAAKCSIHFIRDRRIALRLQQAVKDEETGSAGPAFEILAGLLTSPYPNAEATIMTDLLADLVDSTTRRRDVLIGLLRSPLTDDVRAMLQDYVSTGSKEEAVLATRRLCGLRVLRLEPLSPELQAKVKQTCERAWGQVWWWVPDFLVADA